MTNLRLSANLIVGPLQTFANFGHFQIINVTEQEEIEVPGPGLGELSLSNLWPGDWGGPVVQEWDLTRPGAPDLGPGDERSVQLDFSERDGIGLRDSDDVWDVLIRIRENFVGSGINYTLSQNSSSFMHGALYMIGFDIMDFVERIRPENVTGVHVDPLLPLDPIRSALYIGSDHLYFPGVTHNIVLDDGDAPDFDMNLTNGNDYLRTGVGDDDIRGLGGADTLFGGDGEDTLSGGAGSDSIFGDADDDVIDGGGDADTLFGGEGRDTIEGGDGADSIVGDADDDVIYGGDDADSIWGGYGDDEVHGGAGADVIDEETAGTGHDTLFGDDGDDSLSGGEGNDHLFGDADADTLFGGIGDDHLYGGEHDDVLSGGAGYDTLDGGSGNDDVATFTGSCDEYDISNQDGQITITHARGSMQDGTDTLIDVEFAQFVDGEVDLSAENPSCQTHSVALVIDVSGSMTDNLDAAKASSLAIIEAVFGTDDRPINARMAIITFNDTGEIRTELHFTDHESVAERKAAAIAALNSVEILGGGEEPLNGALLSALRGDAGPWLGDAGSNRIVVFSDEPAADPELRDAVITLSKNVNIGLNQNNHGSNATKNDAASTSAGTSVSISSVVSVVSGGFVSIDDAQVLATTTGGQVIEAHGTSDVSGALVKAVISSTSSQSAIFGTSTSDELIGNNQGSSIFGLAGADTLIGNEGSDFLDGGSGDDLLFASLGSDLLRGGEGRDVFVIGAHDGDGVIIDFQAGLDMVHLNGVAGSFADLVVTENIDGVLIEYSPEIVDGGSLLLAGISVADLSTANFGFGVLNRGTDGADELFGTEGADNLLGRGGADTIHGYGGNDLLVGDKGTVGDTGNDFLYGGDGDDELVGGSGNDTLFGGVGNDTLRPERGVDVAFGGEGDDFLIGGTFRGTLYGGSGNDSITAGPDQEYIFGGTGDDAIEGSGDRDYLFGDHGNDSILGGAGRDTLGGGAGNDTLGGGAGGDTFIFGQAHGSDVITDFETSVDLIELVGIGVQFTDLKLFDTPDGVEIQLLSYGANNAVLLLRDVSSGELSSVNFEIGGLIGTEGNDDFVGTIDTDSIDGLEGDDTLRGLDGDDSLIGSQGNDVLYGGTGDDYVFGHADADSLYGDLGNDEVRGGFGNDILFGGAGNDLVNSWHGADTAYGGAGNDTLEGGLGSGTLFGGLGDDILVAGTDFELLYGGDGNDVYDGQPFESNAHHFVYLGNGDDTGYGSNFSDGIDGEAGSDTIFGNGGLDIIYGGSGDDYVDGGGEGDSIFAGSGNDDVRGSDGSDKIYGGDDHDLLDGGNNDDELFGGSGDDYISGGAGTDLLYGGAGNDTLRLTDAFDSFFGGDGLDLVDFSEYSSGVQADFGYPGFVSIEGFVGSNFDDTLTGDDRENFFDGGAGNDELFGGGSGDTLRGGGGSDALYGGEGLDTAVFDGIRSDYAVVDAGSGSVTITNDIDSNVSTDTVQEVEFFQFDDGTFTLSQLISVPSIVGTAGNDDLIGDDGDNTLLGFDGDDTLTGSVGDDFFVGGAGADTYFGGDGTDTVSFSDAVSGLTISVASLPPGTGEAEGDSFFEIERIVGTGFNDILLGSLSHDDTLLGGGGNDVIDGDDGDDSLSGEEGNDKITGGGGDDLLSGGDGVDTFIYDFMAGSDTISDFDVTSDVIDIRQTRLHYDDLTISGSGADTLIVFDNDTPSDGQILLQGVDASTVGETNFRIRQDGTNGDDTLYGTEGDDELFGGDGDDYLSSFGGNDLLNGRSGDDTLIGGTGNDRYFFDSANDQAFEAPNEGIDYVYGSVSIILAPNIEFGVFHGRKTSTDEFNVTGNASDNWITGNAAGNTLAGGDGSDRLLGYEGDDVIIGGAGRDILEGGVVSDSTLDSGTDTFVFNSGDNADLILDFEVGRDIIDISNVEIAFVDVVIGSYSGGASIVYDLGTVDPGVIWLPGVDSNSLSFSNFLTFHGEDQPVIEGGAGSDVLRGSRAADELNGLEGNDKLYGYAGADTMSGGAGDDRYFIENADDLVIEFDGEGSDEITTSISFALPDYVENIGTNTTSAVDLTGNSLVNRLNGNDASNTLRGEAGGDRLIGKGGSDRLIGGTGNDHLDGGTVAIVENGETIVTTDGAVDTFVFNLGDGIDHVYDFELGIDLIDVTGTGISFAEVQIAADGDDARVYYEAGVYNTNFAIVHDVDASALTEDSFIFV